MKLNATENNKNPLIKKKAAIYISQQLRVTLSNTSKITIQKKKKVSFKFKI